MRVIIQGRLRQRSYETKEGEKRTVFEVEVDEVGPSLRNATAKVTKAQRNDQGGGQQGGQQQTPRQGQWSQQGPPSNGWGQQGAPAGNGWGAPSNDQSPPF
jgi:single-strand DNA-binding protein